MPFIHFTMSLIHLDSGKITFRISEYILMCLMGLKNTLTITIFTNITKYQAIDCLTAIIK